MSKEMRGQISKICNWKQLLNEEGKIIGWGSSRKVYDDGSNIVMKKAYESIGIFQNENEAMLSKQSDVNEILNVVIDYADDFTWIKTKKAVLVSDDDITNYIKYFWDLERYFNYGFLEDEHRMYLDNNEFVQKLKILIDKYKLNYMDLTNYKNYGLINNKLKLIDFGLTTDYNKNNYKMKLTESYRKRLLELAGVKKKPMTA